jgi:hypothetical protein
LSLAASGVAAAALAGAAWGVSQSQAAVAGEPSPPARTVSESARDVQAALFVDRLSAASGRSLTMLAAQVADPRVNPPGTGSATVAGAAAASEAYDETLAELTEAEEAAAAGLAETEEELRLAEGERDKAAAELANEEAAAAAAVDAAIEAAIEAARAQSFDDIDDLLVGGGAEAAGPVLEGVATNTTEVLALVRKHFPADEVGNAMAVARCESGHANRVSSPNGNGTRDFGVFQLNDGGTIQAALRSAGVAFSDIADARSKALDPAMNVRLAREIWDSRGWQPWVCAAKIKVVAGLYQRAPGPMYGQFDELGRAL